MGHAGAIISGGKGTAAEKMKALKAAGIHVVDNPALIGETMAKALKGKLGKPKRTAARSGKGAGARKATTGKRKTAKAGSARKSARKTARKR